MRKDRRVATSRTRLVAAVTELIDSQASIERVTITKIVEAAGLTRPTFYAVFDDIPSAFAAAALSRLDEAFAGLGVETDLTVDGTTEPRREQMLVAFDAILARLASHAEFFSRVLRGPGGLAVQERIVEYIAGRLRDSSPAAPALAAGPLPISISSFALAGGVVWVITRWIQEDSPRPVVEVATELRDFVDAAVFGGLGAPPDP